MANGNEGTAVAAGSVSLANPAVISDGLQPGEGGATQEQMAQAITTVIRSAIDEYDLVGRDVAKILHVSPSFVSRLHRELSTLAPGSDEYERGVMLVRTFDALGSLIGNPAQVREFLYGPHETLDGRPIELMQNIEGLVDVTRYFESRAH